MKPVRLPASATLALPRWSVVALCLLYILPGLIRRDPWKNDDAAGFGIMWTMAHGGWQDWLLPHIVGLPVPGEGPLAFWFGALFIKLFGWLLGDALAARISTIGFFVIGALSIWYATYLLGRRAEAQPLRLAFGGQPEARDYGRTLADGALLIYLACLGLLLRSHETTAEALQTSLIGFGFYAGVRVFESQSLRSAAALGVTLGLLVLTRGYLVPLALWSMLVFVAPSRGRHVLARLLLVTLPLALAISASWPVANMLLRPYDTNPTLAWLAWNADQVALPSWDTISYFLKYEIWYAWPAWPFAAWAVFAWRKQHYPLHIALPLAVCAGFALLAIVDPHGEESLLLPLLPPLAILGAFGLPTMKRGAINAVDWFAMMTLSTCAAFIWIGWIAKETGWPPKIAHNAFKLAPGFKPEFNLTAFLIAFAATVGWILVVRWRLSRQPSVLWRAVVLSSGGVILCWLLLMTLWLPWLNYGKSYAGVAQQIGEKLPASGACVDTNVGPAQRASFAYFGKIEFSRFGKDGCDYLLLQDRGNAPVMKRDEDSRLQLLWEGRRPSDRDERFRLYRRVGGR
ncbi:ArnT family glycosyltransferase [Noviherbaspirillum pedocola]|uniref:Glycosyltransferase n=1 Tax=Noviherbaspirillum pedocola TaxID=2801341 RepID=A0A934T351_9BURK|nr:glycosyltransferase [Noviherbaspirillum pedocola]MBK4737438.1 glycosyltransferase [Noviherbaspirillum pedocola]